MTKAQAKCNLDSSIQAARVAIATANPGRSDIPHDLWMEHIEEIESAIARIRTGDLSDLEASLYSQAKALEKQFFRFSELAAQLYITNPPASERAFSLALKAQKQCRQSIMALNEMRNPKRTTFIRRQQNNLLMAQPDQVRSQLPQSTSQEFTHAQMDARSQSEASQRDPRVEAVAIEHRPAN